jgi:phosphate transport system substrate-binding protein
MHTRTAILPARTALIALSSLLIVSCGGSSDSKSTPGPLVIKGAGATAPNLAYAQWFPEFVKGEPGLKVEYQANGSGEGVRLFLSGAVDFAASEIPLTDEQIAKLPAKPLHFPTLVSAIVPVYNVANAPDLKFTPAALAGIFSGKIKTWSDPAIAQANPGVALPAAHIVVVHRSDASGSTYTFTEFLSKTNPAWKKDIGQGAEVKWPVGEGAAGSQALADLVKKTPNSIGYVELNYAEGDKLSSGAVKNAAGKFQKAELMTLGAAVDSAQNQKTDFRVSITNPESADAYPICTLTWLIVSGHVEDIVRQKAIKRFLRYNLTEGQQIAMKMDYGVLQPPLIDRIRDQVDEVR